MTRGKLWLVFNSRKDTHVKNYFTQRIITPSSGYERVDEMLLTLGINLKKLGRCDCGGPLTSAFPVCKDCLDKEANYDDGREWLDAQDQLAEMGDNE